MKAQLRAWSSSDGAESGKNLFLWCPACDALHAVEVERHPTRWEWDGNLEAPTINPSILVSGVQWDQNDTFYRPNHRVGPGGRTVCHSFVRAGRWEFLADSTHNRAGQTVDMVDLPDRLTP